MDSQNELVIVEHEQIGSGTFGKVFKVRFSFIVITFLSFLYIFKLQNSRWDQNYSLQIFKYFIILLSRTMANYPELSNYKQL